MLEVFKGLPADTREVTLVSDYKEERMDDLLVSASPMPQPGVFFYSRDFGTGRTVEREDDPELVYLRQYAKGELPATAWLEGRVVQNFEKRLSSIRFAPLDDVQVTVTIGDRTWRTRTAADGRYRLKDLPPGEFRVTFDKEGWTPIEVLRPDKRPLAPGRCARAYGSASTTASITVDLREPDGNPVGLWLRQPDGSLQWLMVPVQEEPSHPRRYRFSPVPTGDLVMAAVDSQQQPRRFAPGTDDPTKARVFRLGRHEQLDGVVFEIRKPR